jgi:hypothetical protein
MKKLFLILVPVAMLVGCKPSTEDYSSPPATTTTPSTDRYSTNRTDTNMVPPRADQVPGTPPPAQ